MTGISVLLSGVVQGGEYAVVVLGFALIWSATRVVNLAQGALAVAGAYLTWLLQTALAVPVIPALLVSSAALMALGSGAGYVTVPALRNRPGLMILIVTFGLGLALQGLVTLGFSDDYRMLPPLLGGADLAGGRGPADLTSLTVLAACAAACTGAIALWRSKLGRVMAAVGADRETVRTLGIRPQCIEALAVGLGTAFAGVGGALAGLTGAFHPADASRYTLVCAVIAIAVGLGSPRRAVATAAAVGIADALGRYLLGGAATALAEILFLVAVLLARGAGFLHDGQTRAELDELAR